MNTITTADVIAAMLTENTGRSILDSGDAYGRHWQRNAGMTATDWDAAPSATIDRWGCVTVSAYHYMSDRLTYHRDLDEQFQEFAQSEAREGTYYLQDMADWVAELTGDNDLRSWNTYNGEDLLSQVLQGITFEYDGEHYAILQTHNGADVRGGYSTPRVFRVDVDMAECFPYDNADADIFCQSCEWGGTLQAGHEWVERGGNYGTLEFGKSEDSEALCPECGGTPAAAAAYPC